MHRNRLYVRATINGKVEQPLKDRQFCLCMKQESVQLEKKNVRNMDKVLATFDMPANYTAAV